MTNQYMTYNSIYAYVCYATALEKALEILDKNTPMLQSV